MGTNLQRLATIAMLLAALIQSPVAYAAHTEVAELTSAIGDYNETAEVALPLPTPEELERLAAGEIVIVQERNSMRDSNGNEQDRIRTVGYRVFERPRLLVWLAALDPVTQHSEKLTEHLIGIDNNGGARWYQYLRLPWPIRNRHWVIRSSKNRALNAATGGSVWEHAWRLDENGRDTAQRLLATTSVAGLDTRKAGKAIYMPINRGGWTMFALSEQRVLVATHAAAILGGWVPERLAARFVTRELNGLLNGLEAKSDTIHARYDGKHPVFSGEGRLITPAMAVTACTRFRNDVADC